MTESSSWRTALASLASSGATCASSVHHWSTFHAKVICVDCVGEWEPCSSAVRTFHVVALIQPRNSGHYHDPKAVRAVDSTVNGDYPLVRRLADSTNAPPRARTGIADHRDVVEHSISPGDEDSLSIHAPKGDDSCDWQSRCRALPESVPAA